MDKGCGIKASDKMRELAWQLGESGIEYAVREAELFIRHGLDINTLEIYRDDPVLTDEQIKSIESMVKRRQGHEPLQYILGHAEFMGLKLMVGPGVLIPRPETELLAEHAVKTVMSYKSRVTHDNKSSSLKVLDVCTGCGCLALTIAKEFHCSVVYGTDISDIAIGYADINARINGVKNTGFLKGRLFSPLKEMTAGSGSPLAFDLIVSNPPYVKRGDIPGLQPEVREWEPLLALDGGEDGLDFYRELIPSARSFLRNGGLIMFEAGAGQAEEVARILDSSGYTRIEVVRDLAGIERIVQAEWKK
jgi:release factor glutamine methyltransferase